MSGFAGLAATSVFVTLLISISSLYAVGNENNLSSAVEAVRRFSDLNRLNRISSLEVEGISVSSSIITANITNSGASSEAVTDLSKNDVILFYTVLPSGSRRVSWFPYAKTLAPEVWVIDKVFTGNRQEEVINPVNVTAETGHFDPGEVIQIKIQLASGFEADTSKPVTLTFALSNGAVATKSS